MWRKTPCFSRGECQWNDEEDKPAEELVLDVATFGDDLDSLSYKFYEVHENGNLINKIYYTEDEVFG